jgi:DNA adenine methylase
MLLRRLGNKSNIAMKIQEKFPPHTLYIEPFFGAGGMFFNKPKAKYNIVNDNDSEVFNLFQVLSNNREELTLEFLKMPVHIDLWNYWKANKETEPVKKAIRFLFLSNYGYLGKPNTLRYGNKNTSSILLQQIDEAAKFMFGVDFMNCDFREMFKKISFRDENEKAKTFIYADPPYLNTDDNYETSFEEKDSADLFDVLQNTGIKWAMSEFDHPFIIAEAEKRNLIINYIGERQNLMNRRIEILVTNYKTPQLKLFTNE